MRLSPEGRSSMNWRVKTAVVFGGYGVFGSLVARELAARSVPLVVAGIADFAGDALPVKEEVHLRKQHDRVCR